VFAESGSLTLCFYVFSHQPLSLTLLESPAAAYLENRPTVTDTKSDLTILQVKRWLNECQEQHEKCPRYTAPKLPTRIIDVGTTGDHGSVRLHISEPNERADNVALSYCWGGPQVSTTTVDILSQNIEGLNCATLPQTLQDAIFFTRKLGIGFLWVDVLCIIQDNTEDKAKETTP
jgi:hypothetical protein